MAEAARKALLGVVESGTAQRLKSVFTLADGSRLVVGGKTGTGDHRQDSLGKGGRVLSSRVLSRSATLMFLLGEHHYGTVMVFVNEPHAADFRFTSSLPTALLKAMAPSLGPLLANPGCP